MKPSDQITVHNLTNGTLFLTNFYKIERGCSITLMYEELFDNEDLRDQINSLKASGAVSVSYPVGGQSVATFVINGTPSVVNNEDGRRYVTKAMTLHLASVTRVTAGTSGTFTAAITVNGVAQDNVSISQTDTSPQTEIVDIDVQAGDELGINITAIEAGAPLDYCVQLWTN